MTLGSVTLPNLDAPAAFPLAPCTEFCEIDDVGSMTSPPTSRATPSPRGTTHEQHQFLNPALPPSNTPAARTALPLVLLALLCATTAVGGEGSFVD